MSEPRCATCGGAMAGQMQQCATCCQLRVARWTSRKEAEKHVPDHGGLGGFFRHGMRWPDYRVHQANIQHIEALRRDILARRIWHGGDWHQNADDGCPIFSDGSTALFSYRAWGDLLAATWSTHLDRNLSYMDFYMEATLADREESSG